MELLYRTRRANRDTHNVSIKLCLFQIYEYFVPIPLYNAVMFCSWEDLAKIETNAAAYFFFKNGRYFFNCSPLPTEIDI